MEIKDTKKKLELELKWGGYYFISSFILSFIYVFLTFIFSQNKETFFIFLIFNLCVFTYFLFKCILEIKHEKRVNIFSKLRIALNMFLISYMLNSFIIGIDQAIFIIQKNEIEIQENKEDIFDSNSNLLNDLITILKIKIM